MLHRAQHDALTAPRRATVMGRRRRDVRRTLACERRMATCRPGPAWRLAAWDRLAECVCAEDAAARGAWWSPAPQPASAAAVPRATGTNRHAERARRTGWALC